ncbi:MAG: DsrE family protein [Nitrosomonadales bacterium]|nr:DsrE family protein [Nitrosomonadales bacterium]
MKYIKVWFVALALACISFNTTAADAPARKEKLVMQVSDGDAGKWNLALNNAKNAQQDYGADKIDIEIVTYGPGIGMLKSDSAVAKRIEEAKQSGITLVACQNTMKAMKLTESDMLPNTSYVPSGVVELIKKQRDGYAYIRP